MFIPHTEFEVPMNTCYIRKGMQNEEIMVVWSIVKAKFYYAILVADRSEVGRRPAASWNLAYHLAR